jgi:hypothetical protein
MVKRSKSSKVKQTAQQIYDEASAAYLAACKVFNNARTAVADARVRRDVANMELRKDREARADAAVDKAMEDQS